MKGGTQYESERRDDETEELNYLRPFARRVGHPTEEMLEAGFAAYCERLGEEHPGFAHLTTSGREAFAAFFNAAVIASE